MEATARVAGTVATEAPRAPGPAHSTMLAQAEPTRADAEHYVRENSSLPLSPAIFERAAEVSRGGLHGRREAEQGGGDECSCCQKQNRAEIHMDGIDARDVGGAEGHQGRKAGTKRRSR